MFLFQVMASCVPRGASVYLLLRVRMSLQSSEGLVLCVSDMMVDIFNVLMRLMISGVWN